MSLHICLALRNLHSQSLNLFTVCGIWFLCRGIWSLLWNAVSSLSQEDWQVGGAGDQTPPRVKKKAKRSHPSYGSCPRKYPLISREKLGDWNGPTSQRIVSWVKAKRVGAFASHCWTKDSRLCLCIDPEDLYTWKEGIFHCLQMEKFWKKGLMPNIFLSLVCQKGSGKCL